MTIIVCPLHLLDEQVARERPARVISLLSPEALFPETPAEVTRLKLELHDIPEAREGLTPPDRAMVAALLEFGTAWREPGPMIVHCWAGISRSTAAALILACALDPARDEQAAADALRAASPTATPNALMIALADDLLGRQGRLIRAAASIGPGELAMWGEPFRIRARG